jgi:hypothetical protein
MGDIDRADEEKLFVTPGLKSVPLRELSKERQALVQGNGREATGDS